MITIGIAEDQVLFRVGIVHLLNSVKDFQVIVEAENGQDLLEKYGDLELGEEPYPDITILDLRMPVMDGIKTTEKLKKIIPDSKIIIISSHNDVDIIVHLYEKGANAFLDKNAEPEEVEQAINSVMYNDFYFNETARTALEENPPSERDIRLDVVESLSERERDILKLICTEKTSQEIADILFISKRTVDNHRTSLIQKVGAKNITGLVLFAIRADIVNVSELKISPY